MKMLLWIFQNMATEKERPLISLKCGALYLETLNAIEHLIAVESSRSDNFNAAVMGGLSVLFSAMTMSAHRMTYIFPGFFSL